MRDRHLLGNRIFSFGYKQNRVLEIHNNSFKQYRQLVANQIFSTGYKQNRVLEICKISFLRDPLEGNYIIEFFYDKM